MILTISGTPGAGKGTVGKLLAKKLEYKFYSMGDVRREYAEERGMTLQELNKLAEIDPTSDQLVDEYQSDIAKKETDLVIESRLGFFFIPDSFKIYLDADERTRAKRIFNAHRTTEKYSSIDDTIIKLRERIESDKKRYAELYDINPYDLLKSKYNLMLYTEFNKPSTIVRTILTALKPHLEKSKKLVAV